MGLITANNIMREISKLQDRLEREKENNGDHNAHYKKYLQKEIIALKIEAYYEYI